MLCRLSYPGTRPNGPEHEESGYQPGSAALSPKTTSPRENARVPPIGYNDGMHRRTAFVAGLAVGYYLGARAGRERYEQIRAVLDDLQVDRALEKGRALVELAVVRVQEAREARGAMVLPFPDAVSE